eukprot:Clim_evm43s239 gene=Clim_evmTU43s239
MATLIYHLAPKKAYEESTGDKYFPAGFEKEGFVHATAKAELLLDVANWFYKNMEGNFITLSIDESKLTSKCIYEAPAPVAGREAYTPEDQPVEKFPHIYGGIDKVAVISVYEVKRAEDGTFLSVC